MKTMTINHNNNIPLVSVCILTYNQQNTIAETIESVLKQECKFDIEIIIAEDCSTDLTLEICKRYQTLHPGVVRLITLPENVGLMRNFNNATKRIRGKYFACCGGDDFWHDPYKLQLQVEFMERNPHYGMIHTGCNYFYTNNSQTKEVVRENQVSGNMFESILTGTYGNIIASSAIIRTSFFNKNVCIEDYLKKGYLMEDFPMWLDLSFHSNIGYIAKSLVTYRVSDESVSQSKNMEKMLIFLKSRWKVQLDYAHKYTVKHRVLNRIKKNKNDICIDAAFNSEKFKQSIGWIKNVDFKNLFINPSSKNFLLLTMILFNIKYKHVKWIKNLWQQGPISFSKMKFISGNLSS